MYQDNLKFETKEFLKKFVYPYSKFSVITNDNADEIINFIVMKYVSPIVNLQESEQKVDQNFLSMAEAAIDDISEN